MSQETIRWKLFPFSLDERAKQWYAHNIGKVARDWEELRNRFYLTFFPIYRIATLRQEILNFQQKEKETIGAAWDRFSILSRSGPDLSIPNHVLLQHFWLEMPTGTTFASNKVAQKDGQIQNSVCATFSLSLSPYLIKNI